MVKVRRVGIAECGRVMWVLFVLEVVHTIYKGVVMRDEVR
jgi:hypothetical protein